MAVIKMACPLFSTAVDNAGLKVDARREISTVVMMSYYKNVRLCKTDSSSSHVLFLAIRFAFSWPRDSLP